MSKEDRLRRVEESESFAIRLRRRFGVDEGNPGAEQVREWLNSRGAIPVTLACAALAIYLVTALINELI